MGQPTPFNRLNNFTDPVAAVDLNAEVDAVELTLDGLCTNIALIQRDDGALANVSVHPESLTPTVLGLMSAGLVARGDWLTGTAYAVHNAVIESGQFYVCLVLHVAGTFNTDLAAGKWMLFSWHNLFSQSGTYPAGTVGKKLQQIVSVTDAPFYADPTGGADSTAAIQAAAAYVRSIGGNCTIDLGKNATYSVWPSGAGSTLFDFTGCIGITVLGNGATLSAGNVNSTTPKVFDLKNASSIKVSNLNYVQSYLTLDSANGAILFNMEESGSKFLFENITQTGGVRGLHCLGIIASGTKISQIVALNCAFTNVYYPQQFRLAGDQYYARGIRTINCGRGYFPFNVRDHDVEMFSQHGGQFDDCLLKNYTYSAEYNRLENIRLVYSTDKRHASASAQVALQALVVLEFQLVDVVAGYIDNIDITVNVIATSTNPAQRVFIMRKFDAAGNNDTTARGHKVSNVKLSGNVSNWENGQSTALDLFSTSSYNWTGDYAQNIRIQDLNIEDSSGVQKSLIINGQPFSATANLILENVFAGGSVERVNWDSSYPFQAINVQSSTLVVSTGWKSYTPTWTSSGTAVALGNGVLSGKWKRVGDQVTVCVSLTMGSTTTFGTGQYSFALPVASANAGVAYFGSALLYLSVSGNRYAAASRVGNNSSTASLWAPTAAINVGQLVPATWQNTDIIDFQISYMAAPS